MRKNDIDIGEITKRKGSSKHLEDCAFRVL